MPTFLNEDEDEVTMFDASLSFMDEFVEEINAADALLQTDAGEFDSLQTTTNFQLDDIAQVGTEGDFGVKPNGNSHQQLQQQVTLTTKINKRIRKYTKSNPNKARDERRQEVIYLRNQVHALEQQLNRLKKAPHECDARSIRLGQRASLKSFISSDSQDSIVQHRSTEDLSGPSSAISIWKDIARRQYDQQIDAERENIRLKLVLEAQLKIAKSLQAILSKRTISRTCQMLGFGNISKRVHDPSPSDSDRVMYKQLLADADKCHATIDAVFEANGLAQMEYSHNEAHVKEDGADGIYLETFVTKVLPFDMHTTATVVWHHFAHNKDGLPQSFYNRKNAKSPDSTDDTVLESFRVDIKNINATTADFSVKQVIRRYIEEDRVIVIWTTIFESIEFAQKPAPGYHFHGEGYVIIRKPTTLPFEYTLLQTCFRLFPDFSECNRSQVLKTGELTNFVLNFIAMNVTASHQLIENILLEQAMHSTNV